MLLIGILFQIKKLLHAYGVRFIGRRNTQDGLILYILPDILVPLPPESMHVNHGFGKYIFPPVFHRTFARMTGLDQRTQTSSMGYFRTFYPGIITNCPGKIDAGNQVPLICCIFRNLQGFTQ